MRLIEAAVRGAQQIQPRDAASVNLEQTAADTHDADADEPHKGESNRHSNSAAATLWCICEVLGVGLLVATAMALNKGERQCTRTERGRVLWRASGDEARFARRKEAGEMFE